MLIKFFQISMDCRTCQTDGNYKHGLIRYRRFPVNRFQSLFLKSPIGAILRQSLLKQSISYPKGTRCIYYNVKSSIVMNGYGVDTEIRFLPESMFIQVIMSLTLVNLYVTPAWLASCSYVCQQFYSKQIQAPVTWIFI